MGMEKKTTYENDDDWGFIPPIYGDDWVMIDNCFTQIIRLYGYCSCLVVSDNKCNGFGDAQARKLVKNLSATWPTTP